VALRAAGQLGARGARWIAARALVSDPDVEVRAAAAVALRALLGDAADGLLRAVSRASGSPELIDRIAAAPGAVGFAGTASLRSNGAPPATVWTVTLPDGGAAFGVATDDGEVWLRGVPEGDRPAPALADLQ
jgi:streptogramin lyase